MRGLIKSVDRTACLRGEGDEARTEVAGAEEGSAKAAINVPPAFDFGVFLAEDVGRGDGVRERLVEAQGDAGRVLRQEVAAIIEHGLSVEARAKALLSGGDDVGAEEARIPVIRTGVQVQQSREVGARRRQQHLRPASCFLEAFVDIVFAGERVVHVGCALLVDAGKADCENILDERQVDGALDVLGFVVAIRGAQVGFKLILRFAGVELDDAARRVAAE